MKYMIFAASFSLLLWGCGSSPASTNDSVPTPPSQGLKTSTETTNTTQEAPSDDEIGKILGTQVVFNTSKGDITAQIFTDQVPSIAGNFMDLAREGRYDGTIFHRVIEGFMIQGGDYENRNGTGGQAFEGGMIADEFAPGLSHVRGTLSMANRGPNTNGSQFFIMHGEAPHLDGRHAIFGQVTEGMDIVDMIATAPTTIGDRPAEDIVINNIQILSAQ